MSFGTQPFGSVPFGLSGQPLPPIAGTASLTIDTFTLSGSGAAALAGAATPTISAFTSSATGAVAIAGSASPALANFLLSGAGTAALSGTASATIPAFSISGVGFHLVDSDGSLTMTIGDFGLSGLGVITGLALTDILVRVRQNYLLPPPRVTGNTEDDFRKLNQWCHELHDQLVVADNALGVLRALITNTRSQVGTETNVAEQFARMIEKINQLTAQITALEAK